MGDTCTPTTPATKTRVHHLDGVAVVEVVGEIDMSRERPVRAAIAEQLDRRPAALVLDLAEVGFFGSAGVQLVVEAVVRAQRLGVPLAVATDRRAVLRPLEITHVNETVDIHRTLDDALAALRPAGARAEQQVARL